MKNKQEEYWARLIPYICAVEDVISENCDTKAEVDEKRQERLRHLMSNYVLRRKPKYSKLFR